MGCCLPQHEGNFLEDQPFTNAVAECFNEISVDIEGRLKKLCQGCVMFTITVHESTHVIDNALCANFTGGVDRSLNFTKELLTWCQWKDQPLVPTFCQCLKNMLSGQNCRGRSLSSSQLTTLHEWLDARTGSSGAPGTACSTKQILLESIAMCTKRHYGAIHCIRRTLCLARWTLFSWKCWTVVSSFLR